MNRREALIKLAEGHKIRWDNWVHSMAEDGIIEAILDGTNQKILHVSLHESDSYVLVKEPLRFENDDTIIERCTCWPAVFCLPPEWEGKRVRVTVEEIVE